MAEEKTRYNDAELEEFRLCMHTNTYDEKYRKQENPFNLSYHILQLLKPSPSKPNYKPQRWSFSSFLQKKLRLHL